MVGAPRHSPRALRAVAYSVGRSCSGAIIARCSFAMLARVAGLGGCPRALGRTCAFIIPPHRVRLGARRAPSWRVSALYRARLHPPLALSTRRAPLSVRRRAYPPSHSLPPLSARCSCQRARLWHCPPCSRLLAGSARGRVRGARSVSVRSALAACITKWCKLASKSSVFVWLVSLNSVSLPSVRVTQSYLILQ